MNRRHDPSPEFEDYLLDAAIKQRFQGERHPDITVDGEDPWDPYGDTYEEDEDDE